MVICGFSPGLSGGTPQHSISYYCMLLSQRYHVWIQKTSYPQNLTGMLLRNSIPVNEQKIKVLLADFPKFECKILDFGVGEGRMKVFYDARKNISNVCR